MDKGNSKKLIELANLLLPDVKLSSEDVLKMYPKRKLSPEAKVTRIAPSPTGLIHLGVVYAAVISERMAHQSGGIFYLRIEDTDKKREVKGSIQEIIKTLDYFGIRFDEGETQPDKETGAYGPYKQSDRRHIYRVFVKELIQKGLAYPCFCTSEDLDLIRKRQKDEKLLTGYYGAWAKCRNSSPEEVLQKLNTGMPFTIRFKFPGHPDKKIVHRDLIKGDVRFPENIQDIVLLKSDGIPTYHFAHVIDDYLMGTTHVFRDEGWLSSVPIHLQLFDILGWDCPHYGHISQIMKMDGTSKRKFSKRKDMDFAANWYCQQGYPSTAITEYLLSLINSNFVDWRIKNPNKPNKNFTVTINKMGGSGALFDFNKFTDTSKNVIASFNAEEIYSSLIEWSSSYDKDFNNLIKKYREYTIDILNIGRGIEKPRKDFACWSDIKPAISYFYDELFDIKISQDILPAAINLSDAAEIFQAYTAAYKENDDKTVWFSKIKDICSKLGYASDTRLYKRDPAEYKGTIGDVAMVLRLALTGRPYTPDLYDIMQIMGKHRVLYRFNCAGFAGLKNHLDFLNNTI